MSGPVFCQMAKSTSNISRKLLVIEEQFDSCTAFTWLEENWHMCYYFIAVYIVSIFAGKRLMEPRQPFKLQQCLFFWNTSLAIFSILASWRMIPALVADVQEHGFHGSICAFTTEEHKQAIGVWTWLYILSKILEFGDTAFLVLRKSPLNFLHWYHHATVTFFVWCCSGAYMSPLNVYFGTFNVLVHSIMYSYYAMVVVNIKITKAVRMAITGLQLMQMVYGMFLTGYIYSRKAKGLPCSVPDQTITIAITIYVSYFALFLKFFIQTYVMNKPVISHGKKRD